jgi:glutathione S-transferase
VLYDSGVISEYFCALVPGNPILPLGPDRIDTLLRTAQGSGLLDALILLYSERRRKQDDKETQYALAYRIKIGRMLDDLELNRGSWFARPFDLGHATIFSALSYMDLRFEVDAWRQTRPALGNWFDGTAARPSIQATAYDTEAVPPAAN